MPLLLIQPSQKRSSLSSNRTLWIVCQICNLRCPKLVRLPHPRAVSLESYPHLATTNIR